MYQFTRNVVVDGRQASAGDLWSESEFPEGSLGPALRMGHVVLIDDESDDAKADQIEAPRSDEMLTDEDLEQLTRPKT